MKKLTQLWIKLVSMVSQEFTVDSFSLEEDTILVVIISLMQTFAIEIKADWIKLTNSSIFWLFKLSIMDNERKLSR